MSTCNLAGGAVLADFLCSVRSTQYPINTAATHKQEYFT